jgi:hypothetical protein
VEIALKGGRTLREYVPFATGEPENPVAADQLVEKFIGLTASRYSASDASGLATRLLALEKESDLRAIGAALR